MAISTQTTTEQTEKGHFMCENCEEIYPTIEKVEGDTDICFDCWHLGGPY